MIDESALRRQYALLRPSLDERGRRLFAATQAQALGHGGGVLQRGELSKRLPQLR